MKGDPTKSMFVLQMGVTAALSVLGLVAWSSEMIIMLIQDTTTNTGTKISVTQSLGGEVSSKLSQKQHRVYSLGSVLFSSLPCL